MNLPATTTSSGSGNFLTKAIARVTNSLTQMRHAAQSLFFGGLLKRTRFDYAHEVGDMLDASVVMAPIMWRQRALPEATLALAIHAASEPGVPWRPLIGTARDQGQNGGSTLDLDADWIPA